MFFNFQRFNHLREQMRYLVVLMIVMVVLNACVAPVPAPQEPQTPVSTQEPVSESTPEPTPEPTLEPTPEPVAEATPDPTFYFPTPEESELMMQLSRSLIDSIPLPVAAPDGWEIRPCEGMAPLLCIQTDAGEVGSSELGVYALRTYPDFYPILAKYGIPFGSIDVESQAYQEGARPALEEMVAEMMASLAEDRAIGRPQWTFAPLAVESIQFGELPGLQYGFMMTDREGNVQERVLSHVTFDESHIYFFVAVNDPDAVWTLPSDEALLTFEPYLRQIIAGFPLPGSW